MTRKITCSGPRPYTDHECCPGCMTNFFPFLFRDQNPFIVPLLLGWARDLVCLKTEVEKTRTPKRETLSNKKLYGKLPYLMFLIRGNVFAFVM